MITTGEIGKNGRFHFNRITKKETISNTKNILQIPRTFHFPRSNRIPSKPRGGSKRMVTIDMTANLCWALIKGPYLSMNSPPNVRYPTTLTANWSNPTAAIATFMAPSVRITPFVCVAVEVCTGFDLLFGSVSFKDFLIRYFWLQLGSRPFMQQANCTAQIASPSAFAALAPASTATYSEIHPPMQSR